LLDNLLGPATRVNHKGRGRYYERIPEGIYPYVRRDKQGRCMVASNW